MKHPLEPDDHGTGHKDGELKPSQAAFLMLSLMLLLMTTVYLGCRVYHFDPKKKKRILGEDKPTKKTAEGVDSNQ